MQILTKRLNITRATITFGGDLVPLLDLEATTTSGDATIVILLTGLASNPQVSFSSTPSLPQDEILAQLIFGQSLSRLSPLQIAQLADAAAQLAGGRGTSLFQSLRSSLGIDDLDVSTDETGGTSISAGKYLNDRTYIELQQSGSGGAKATINLDIGRGLKLKGEAGGSGPVAASSTKRNTEPGRVRDQATLLVLSRMFVSVKLIPSIIRMRRSVSSKLARSRSSSSAMKSHFPFVLCNERTWGMPRN